MRLGLREGGSGHHGRLAILGRGCGCVGHDNVGKLIGLADNPLGFRLVTREELQEILKLTGILLFQEALSTASLVWVPTELRAASAKLGLLARHQVFPGSMD